MLHKGQLTNTVDLHFYLWAHDFIPPVYTPYQPSRAIEAACPTEWMSKGCCRREVVLDSRALLFWRALTQLTDNMRYVCHCKDRSAA